MSPEEEELAERVAEHSRLIADHEKQLALLARVDMELAADIKLLKIQLADGFSTIRTDLRDIRDKAFNAIPQSLLWQILGVLAAIATVFLVISRHG